MIKRIQFRNYKALKQTGFAPRPFTLIVGPNGSGKSSVLEILGLPWQVGDLSYERCISRGAGGKRIEVCFRVELPNITVHDVKATWTPGFDRSFFDTNGSRIVDDAVRKPSLQFFGGAQVYSLDARTLAKPSQLRPNAMLGRSGEEFASVLDRLRDFHPERFEALNEELSRCIPEFDRILFETPDIGFRAIALRTKAGHHVIPAKDVSEGTLLATCLLTLAYLPAPATMIGLEEPDRGIHPRLLRAVRDILYRLSYPAEFGEKRLPIHVFATTHSPYFLDLFRDHLDEVFLTTKEGDAATIRPLQELPHVSELLEDSRLGDAWYSGVLGGVPKGT